jgi:hypothetical protein
LAGGAELSTDACGGKLGEHVFVEVALGVVSLVEGKLVDGADGFVT